MPSRIEELIAETPHQTKRIKGAGFGGSGKWVCRDNCRTCALERAYREEVVPLVDALQDIRDYWNGHKNERAMGDALDHIVDVSEDALRRFNAPAGTPAAKDESNGNLPRD